MTATQRLADVLADHGYLPPSEAPIRLCVDCDVLAPCVMLPDFDVATGADLEPFPVCADCFPGNCRNPDCRTCIRES